MGFMDKIKNMFTEEEEVEEPIKKEVIQVEIPSPLNKTEEKETMQPKQIIEEIKEEKIIEQEPKKEEKFIFPVYFDDDDFQVIEKKEEKKYTEIKKTYEPKKYYEEKKVTPKPISESYKGNKVVEEEKKTFRPTPIISPVYGVLDKNYTKEDITVKKVEPIKKTSDIDLIRNKAYGTLEDEIVDSIDYEKETTHTNNDMEEYHKKMNEVDFEDIEEKNVDTSLDELESKLSSDDEIKPKYSRTRKKAQEDLNESELFDMIDTMYGEEK